MTEEWRIEKLVPGGAGMARLADGRVGFALGALPNERIAVEASRTRKGYVEALQFRVLDPAKERVAPTCVLAEACGGCDWLHVDYAAQLELKAGLLREALQRTGRFADPLPIRVEASPRKAAYRSRFRVHIDDRGEVGFFARKSRSLVVVESCAAARPELDAALACLRQSVAAQPRLAAQFAEAELRVPPGGKPTLRLTPRGSPAAALRGAGPLLDVLARDFAVVAVAGVAAGEASAWALADDLTLWVPPEAFVQVNWDVNLLLVRALVDGARERGARSFVELYAGAGNFTVALLAAGLSGKAVESEPAAVAAARRSLFEQGLAGGEVVMGDAAETLLAWAGEPPVDRALLDPPRRGALPLIEPLARAAPRFVAYCSCDPVTLARDLRELTARGYRLEAVQGFDMFPGTHHVEALAWLARSS